MADNETPPIPKVRDDGAYSLLQKQGKIEYQSFLLESNQNPIFDLNGASDMTKSDAPEKMKRTLELVKKLDAAFNKKTGKRLIINDAIAKEGTSREKETPGSQHFHGTAVDLGTKEYSNEERDILAELALDLGFTGLGFGAGILHVDTGPQRSWSYGNNTYGTKSVSEWKEIAKNYDHSSSKKTTSQTSTATSTPAKPLPSISTQSSSDSRAYKSTTGQRFGKKTERSYYAPIRENNLSNKFNEMSEAAAASIRKALDLVLQGSNESNYATHNAYGGSSVASNALKYGTEAITIDYGGGRELFYNKNKDDAESLDKNGAAYVKEEKAWLASKDINRSWVKEILKNDPQLEADLITLTYAEVGGTSQKAQQALLESLFNRVRAHKNRTDIYKEVYGRYDSSNLTNSGVEEEVQAQTNTTGRAGLYDKTGTRRGRRSLDSSSDSLLSFGIKQLIQLAPDTALSQIQNQLGSDLEFLAPDVLSSIQSGEGIDPLVSLVDTLTSQDTVAGRVATLGEFAESNKELTSLFSANLTDKLPALPLIIDLLNASPRDRARIVLENKDALQEMLGIDLSSIPESFEYDGNVINLLNALQGTDNTIKTIELAKGAIDIANLALPEDQKIQINETAEAVLQFIKSDDPQIQKEALNKLQALGVELPDEVNYLTATPEELLNNPVVKSELGQAQMLIDPSKGKQDIENMISTYISEQSSISVSGAKTLAFGGGAEAAKKLQSEVGSIAFEGLVESFPILGQIIEFFNQNQGLLTVLGTAGAAAGLSAFTGGGFFGSMVAGAGVMATARLALGEEGYSKFEGILGQGAEQAVGIFREAFQASGLADNEYIAPIVEGLFNFTENNPVASALGATGNLGGALGAYLAQNAIDTMDNPEGMEKLIEGLRSRSNMSSQVGLSQTINNSNGGDQNVPYRPSDQNNPENDTGPKSQEIARVSGDMYRSQAWAHVDTDSGYGWPHNTVNS